MKLMSIRNRKNDKKPKLKVRNNPRYKLIKYLILTYGLTSDGNSFIQKI